MEQNIAIYVDHDEALAGVKFKGRWRFFYDGEIMFLLDYSAYDDTHHPRPGEFRYGTMIVDEANAERWMNSLAHEVSLEQLTHTYWKNSDRRINPTFLIDFDQKLWVGSGWKMDQSPLHEYQPQGWTALEADIDDYLPDELKTYFA
jgi:hypothetical protein